MDALPGDQVRSHQDGSDEKITGDFMPMVANDGPHYGDNIKLKGPGKYKVKYIIPPPSAEPAQPFGRHTDRATGVRPWFKPFEVEYEFTYVGIGKKGGYWPCDSPNSLLRSSRRAGAARLCRPLRRGELEKLPERLEKLEARNAELEKEVQGAQERKREVAKGLESARNQNTSPNSLRLKAVEKDVAEREKGGKHRRRAGRHQGAAA